MKKSAIIALLMVLLLAFSACGDKASDKKEEEKAEASQSESSASSIINAYNEAYLDRDAEAIYKYMPHILEAYIEMDKSEILEEIEGALADDLDDYDDSYDREIKVTETRKVDDAIVEQWNTYLSEYSEHAEYYDSSKHKVTEAKIIEIEITVTYDGESGTESDELVVVKENGEWKLINCDMWDMNAADDFDWEDAEENYSTVATVPADEIDDAMDDFFDEYYEDDYDYEDYYSDYDYYY